MAPPGSAKFAHAFAHFRRFCTYTIKFAQIPPYLHIFVQSRVQASSFNPLASYREARRWQTLA